jgi:hypothetical protein
VSGLNRQEAFPEVDFSMQSVVMFGVAESTASISQQINFNCPVNRCIFPPFTSLAVCSRCEDLTSSIQRNTNSGGDQYRDFAKNDATRSAASNQTEFRLPNDLYINNGQLDPFRPWYRVLTTMAGTSAPRKSLAMKEINTLIWSQSILDAEDFDKASKWPSTPITAQECALYYCVKNYSSEVTGGRLIETSVTLDYARSPDSWQFIGQQYPTLNDEAAKRIHFHPAGSWPNRTDLQLTLSPESSVNISQIAVDGISRFFQNTFARCTGINNNCTKFIEDDIPVNGFFITSVDGISQYGPPVAKSFRESEDLSLTFANIAMSMTNALRNGADQTGNTVIGQIGITTTVYVVDWRWMALHCTLELGAIMFLFSTAWSASRHKASKVPVWKSNPLATLSKGAIVHEALDGSVTIGDLESKAKTESTTLLGNNSWNRTVNTAPFNQNLVLHS